MKKVSKYLLIASTIVLAFASCSKEDKAALTEKESANDNGNKVVLTINAEQPKAQSKTSISGTTPSWSVGDKVNVVYTNTSASVVKAESEALATAGSPKTFTVTLTSPDNTKEAYAYYPVNTKSATASAATLVINKDQTPTGTSFDGGSDILISSKFTPSGTVTPSFKRLGAVLKIKLSNATLSTEKIVSLSVTGENPLAGDVAVASADGTITGISNGSNKVTATYDAGDQFTVSADGKFVYLVVYPQTLTSGSTLTISGETENYNFSKAIVLPSNIQLQAGHIVPLNITISTLSNRYCDVLTHDWTGIGTTGGSYTAWSNINGTVSTAKYAGQSYPNDAGYIQIRATSPSAIVSTTSGGSLKKVSISWNAKNMAGRSIAIYGKNTAYSGNSDMYDEEERGTLIGSITYGTSTYLEISDYYEYIGLLPVGGAVYLDEIDINWTNTKLSNGLVWKKSGVEASSDGATMNTGDDVMPTISLYNPNSLTVSYSSTDTDVATVNPSTGAITLVGGGTSTISATFGGNETYKSGTVSYLLTVTDSRTVCVAPTFSPSAGSVSLNTVVTISSTTTGSTIYYTTDGSTPTTLSSHGTTGAATASVTIDIAKTIKAIAVKDDYKSSDLASATYTVAGVATKLSNPTGLSFSSISTTAFTATWTAVANASSYDWILSTSSTSAGITVGNTKASGNVTSATCSGSTLSLSTGTYYLYVKTKGNGTTYTDADDYAKEDVIMIAIDFTSTSQRPGDFPTSSGTKTGTHTIDGYSFSFSAQTAYYWNSYLMLGKTGSYILTPAISGKKLSNVSFSTTSGVSTNVIPNIKSSDGSSTIYNNASAVAKSSSYSWNLTSTSANTSYRFNVTNNYNIQLASLVLTYKN